MKYECICCGDDRSKGGSTGILFDKTGKVPLTDKDGKIQIKVKICCEVWDKKASFREILNHELQHAYDYCFKNLPTDPDKKTCDQVACSEIKAYKRQGTWNGKVIPENDMKDLAAKSASKKCGDYNKARSAVNTLWDKCKPEELPKK